LAKVELRRSWDEFQRTGPPEALWHPHYLDIFTQSEWFSSAAGLKCRDLVSDHCPPSEVMINSILDATGFVHNEPRKFAAANTLVVMLNGSKAG
jgi:hypothetical protein